MRQFLGITERGWSRVGVWTGMLKNPTKCLWRGSPTVCLTFSSVRLHIYVASMCNGNIVACDVKGPNTHSLRVLKYHYVFVNMHNQSSKNRSTEGCSKLKSPETRQVQEILVSTLEHLQVPKLDRTRCQEE